MRSTFTEAKPASPASATARATWVVPWRRPRLSSTWGTMDCTPNDTRFTPARRHAAKRARAGVLGVALDGDLGIGGRRDHGLEDLAQQLGGQPRRRAPSHVDARGRGQGLLARWPAGARSRTPAAYVRHERRRGRSTWRRRSSRSATRRTARARTRRRARRGPSSGPSTPSGSSARCAGAGPGGPPWPRWPDR